MADNLAPVRVITREVLEDRWEGAIISDDERANDRYLQFIDLLETLIFDVTRCYGVEYWLHREERGETTHMGIVDEVINQARETIITRVLEHGLAH